MARRRLRRGRLVLVAGVVTVVIVLFGSGLVHGARSNRAFRLLVNRTFAVSAAAAAADSATLDHELLAVVVAGPHASRPALQADLDALERTALRQAAFATATLLPGPSSGAARRFVAGLEARAAGVVDLRGAIDAACDLHSSPTPGVAAAALPGPSRSPGDASADLAAAATAFERAEQDFADAAGSLQRGAGHLELSVAPWSATEAQLTAVGRQVFLSALAQSPTLAPVHRLSIGLISLNPPALPLQSTPTSAVVLPTSTLEIGVVVRNLGNVAEHPVAVVLNLEPLDGTGVHQITDHLAIGALGSVAVDHAGIAVHPGHHYRLVVSVLAPVGDPVSASATTQLDITVAAG